MDAAVGEVMRLQPKAVSSTASSHLIVALKNRMSVQRVTIADLLLQKEAEFMVDCRALSLHRAMKISLYHAIDCLLF